MSPSINSSLSFKTASAFVLGCTREKAERHFLLPNIS
jgi:hypothetical protein